MKYKLSSYVSMVTMTATLFFGSLAFAVTPAVAENVTEPETILMENITVSANAAAVTELTRAAVSDNEAGQDVLAMAGADIALDEMMEEMEPSAEPVTYWGYSNLGIANVENHLNVRAYPGEDGRLIGKMSNNAACEILEIQDGWAHITSGELDGYVSTDYLLTGPAAIARATQVVAPIATVTTDALKIRDLPNTECEVITMVPEGERLLVVEEMGDWICIDLDGEEAYVAAEYVEVAEELDTAITMSELLYGEGVSDVRVDICEYAKQFVGNPYVWGGTSLTNGADCSGFVLSIYARYGVTLPHSSRAQANCGTRVSLSEVRPGDLVFYTRGGVINHVAMYIGNGQVIHASSPSTGIRISSMYYRTPYVAVSLLYD